MNNNDKAQVINDKETKDSKDKESKDRGNKDNEESKDDKDGASDSGSPSPQPAQQEAAAATTPSSAAAATPQEAATLPYASRPGQGTGASKEDSSGHAKAGTVDVEDEMMAIRGMTGNKRGLEAFIQERFANNKRGRFGALGSVGGAPPSTDTSQLMPFINIDEETPMGGSTENATTTEGILPLLHILELPGMRTCGRFREDGVLPSQVQVLHVQQKDKFSCGYRNLQILLSALVPQLQHDHPYYQNLPNSLKRSDIGVAVPIPSLTQLQVFLENAWAEGFDPKGAAYYHGKILGKTSKIGAIEVSSLLSWFSIDSVVVQFIKTEESRRLLGPFVWAYFNKKGPCYVSTKDTFHPSTCLSCAEILLREANRIQDYNTPGGGGRARATDHHEIATSNHPLLPMYLQWEGHSVSIVGVQRKPKQGSSNRKINSNNQDDGDDGSGFDYDLLVFDPKRDGDFLHKSLSRAFELENTAEAVGPMLLPAANFAAKDSQIVLASVRPLPSHEREFFRQKINATTAARIHASHPQQSFQQQQQQQQQQQFPYQQQQQHHRNRFLHTAGISGPPTHVRIPAKPSGGNNNGTGGGPSRSSSSSSTNHGGVGGGGS